MRRPDTRGMHPQTGRMDSCMRAQYIASTGGPHMRAKTFRPKQGGRGKSPRACALETEQARRFPVRAGALALPIRICYGHVSREIWYPG